MPKPSFSKSSNTPASSRYKAAALEPGAKEDFTQGLRVKPNSLALRANRPAATVLRGFDVLVHEVIAAMMTAPSGIKPSVRFSTTPAIPFSFRSAVETRACGFDGPAILRVTVERSKRRTRGYSASFISDAQRPISLA